MVVSVVAVAISHAYTRHLKVKTAEVDGKEGGGSVGR